MIKVTTNPYLKIQQTIFTDPLPNFERTTALLIETNLTGEVDCWAMMPVFLPQDFVENPIYSLEYIYHNTSAFFIIGKNIISHHQYNIRNRIITFTDSHSELAVFDIQYAKTNIHYNCKTFMYILDNGEVYYHNNLSPHHLIRRLPPPVARYNDEMAKQYFFGGYDQLDFNNLQLG